MADAPDRPSAPAPRVLPWAFVAALIATGLGILGPVAFVFPHGLAAVAFGMLAGLFGTVMSPRGATWPAISSGVGALGLLMLAPSEPVLWAIGGGLCALAGVEAKRSGGRAIVLVLFCWLALVLVPGMPVFPLAAPWAIYGLVAGWGAARLMGLGGRAVRAPGTAPFGIGMALFLGIGVWLAVMAMRWADQPFGHWLVFFVLLRALAPPGQAVTGAVRFGIGAMLGSLAALGVLMLDLPYPLVAGLGAVLALLGLRHMPHPAPITPAAFSAGVLLAMSPPAGVAVFRIEAAAFAVVLSIVLVTALSAVWSLASGGRYGTDRTAKDRHS